MAAARSANREVYIDTFRGLMALVMVQGHLCDTLLRPAIRAQALYQFQTMFHGSTAPGFLFASGFVAGLPRAPLSARAAVCAGPGASSSSSASATSSTFPTSRSSKTLAATPGREGARSSPATRSR